MPGHPERGGRNCPATRGNPTSMTGVGWGAVCAATRREAEEELDIGNRKVMYKGACLLCSGAVPPEVTIIELSVKKNIARKEEEMKAIRTAHGECTYCRERKTIKMQDGKAVCATCDTVRANIRLRPAMVLESIKELAPDLLPISGEMAATDAAGMQQICLAKDKDLAELKGQIQETRDRYEGRLEALKIDLQLAHEKLAEAKASMCEHVVEKEKRQDVQDLALRLAVCLLKGELCGIGVNDVEMLRAV